MPATLRASRRRPRHLSFVRRSWTRPRPNGWSWRNSAKERGEPAPPGPLSSDGCAGGFQPCPDFRLDQRPDPLQHPGMIAIQPRMLVTAQQILVNQAAIERAPGQRLETEHRTLAPIQNRRLGNDQQVFDPDAMRALAIETGLIREDHARLQRRFAPAGQADRTFMHIETGADTISGAVIIIHTHPPKRDASQGVELAALYPLWKTGMADPDHALQHKREMPPILA